MHKSAPLNHHHHPHPVCIAKSPPFSAHACANEMGLVACEFHSSDGRVGPSSSCHPQEQAEEQLILGRGGPRSPHHPSYYYTTTTTTKPHYRSFGGATQRIVLDRAVFTRLIWAGPAPNDAGSTSHGMGPRPFLGPMSDPPPPPSDRFIEETINCHSDRPSLFFSPPSAFATPELVYLP